MDNETRELSAEELDSVSGGIDIGGALRDAARLTFGLINAGLNALTSGGIAPKGTWL
jgi:hypothetical protein